MVTEVERYQQGSEACRNYSTLTMQVRTVAQHALIGYVVGASVLLSRSDVRVSVPPTSLGWALLGGGLALLVFAASLHIVNWHFATAFIAIRDTLAAMEDGRDGPWSAHKTVRSGQRDVLAHTLPFALLAALGLISFFGGASLLWPSWRNVWVSACGVVGVVLMFVAGAIFAMARVGKTAKYIRPAAPKS